MIASSSGELGTPVEQLGGPSDVGVRADDVTRTRPGLDDRDRRAEDALERGHELAHGDAVTAADVDDHARVRRPRAEHLVEPLDGTHVRPRQVPHVDVVADAGAVAGRVGRCR